MKQAFGLSILFLGLVFMSSQLTFKDEQKRYKRVRTAYSEKGNIVSQTLQKNSIKQDLLHIYIRIFKADKILELWGKNKTNSKLKLLQTYTICESSGSLGPKRQQGDMQVPEGFYHINHFNPFSNFYLSLGINYPNSSDRILGSKSKLGGDIYIHGNCVTIGCVPITDSKIKELYIYCVEAKNNGQSKIPVTIYPIKMTEVNFRNLSTKFKGDSDKINLWTDLKQAFTQFDTTHQIPKIKFLKNGRHEILNNTN